MMSDTTVALLPRALATLRRRWAMALFTSLTVLAGSVPFIVALPDMYRASANILVEGTLFENSSADAAEIDARLQAIKLEALSRAPLTALIEEFHLSTAAGETALAGALSRLQRDIQVDVTGTSQRGGQLNTVAFKLSYVGTDPATSARLANALASFYVAQNDKLRAKAATYRTEVLKASLADAKKKLDSQEQRVAAFTARNIGSLPQQISVNQAALARVSMDLQSNTNEQIRQRERRQALIAQISEIKSHTAEDDSDPGQLLSKRTRELETLRMNETDDSPDVRAKQREIRALVDMIGARTARGDEASSRLATLQSELADVEAQLQKISGQYDALRASMSTYESRIENAPVRNAELEAIMADYRAARDLYDSLQKRYDEADVAGRAEQGHPAEQFRILDAAVPPSAPAGPNRMQLLAAAFALVVAAGLGLVFVVDWFDTSFHSIYELRDFTHVPIVASIPEIVTRRARARRVIVACAVAGTAAVFLGLVGSGAFEAGRRSEAISRTLVRLG